MIEVSEQGYSGQEDSTKERKYDVIHNKVRSTGAGFENTFSYPSLTWQEMQIFKKTILNVYSYSPDGKLQKTRSLKECA